MNLYSKSLHGTLAAILMLFSIGAYAQQTGGILPRLGREAGRTNEL